MQTGNSKSNNKFKTGLIFVLLTAGCFFLVLALFSNAQAKTTSPALSTWFVEMNQYADGAHGSLKCEECHGPMIVKKISKKTGKDIVKEISKETGQEIDRPSDNKITETIDKTASLYNIHPDPKDANFLTSQTKRKFDYQSCKKCHKSAHDRYRKGEHAKALTKEITEGKPSKTGFAPTCGDCHSAHYSKSHRSRPMIGVDMTQTCGACHPDQKTSYLANYHGKAAVNLGYEKAAFCTDCHGAHTTFSLKDKELVLKTCKRCHSDATPEFSNIIIHDSTKNLELKSDAKKSGLKWVHWLGSLSLFFVVAVLVFFYTHTGLLMLRKLHEKLRRHK